jgi:c(7)-type cytochrome triheme protein
LLGPVLGAADHRPNPPAPPRELIFPARPGQVRFDHARHTVRVKGDCAACHNGLFLPDAKAPLNWKPGMHQPAQAHRTSCGGCHRPAGAAFETKDNCHRCHTGEPEL